MQLEVKVTDCGEPVVPDEGDAEHPTMLQVNWRELGIVSATVMVIVTLTVAARTGTDGNANKTQSDPTAASSRVSLLDRK